MKGWLAELDAACAWVNPGLVLVAVAIALLDLAVAAQRWAVLPPEASPPVTAEIVMQAAERCAPALPPELRGLAGID